MSITVGLSRFIMTRTFRWCIPGGAADAFLVNTMGVACARPVMAGGGRWWPGGGRVVVGS